MDLSFTAHLGEVADFEALAFNLELNFIRNPNVQFSTKPAILPNCCSLLGFYAVLKLLFKSVNSVLQIYNLICHFVNFQRSLVNSAVTFVIQLVFSKYFLSISVCHS